MSCLACCKCPLILATLTLTAGSWIRFLPVRCPPHHFPDRRNIRPGVTQEATKAGLGIVLVTQDSCKLLEKWVHLVGLVKA